MRRTHTEVEIVFLASVARIRHLYSMDSPAALSFLFCSLDFEDANRTSNIYMR